ncbi:MAG: hypothetical protein CVU56_01875 [Deltaproteobacteria bacterium HGW-Deltaproteobacteria-14]|jgi:farnesyl-diphosphate farnesyltransferase|nr:MAG: hypothetical protein CVU56_01875 [Deltaproteobacteria bacterium HGW-Deltaproteobacteria-14]
MTRPSSTTFAGADASPRLVTATTDDWAFCRAALLRVSRTFAIPIGMLRERLEVGVTASYLLCRIVDTVEDDPGLTVAQKNELFERFQGVLAGAPAAAFEDRFVALTGLPATHPEHVTARQLSRVLAVMARLPADHREIILRWVSEMARGMAVYANRRPGPDGVVALTTLADLERYSYFVAGTVGQLLTELFELELDLTADPARAHRLHVHGEGFGLGLQLVNIVKDLAEDHARGWSFIPRAAWEAEGLTPATALAPAHRARARAALAPVFARARAGLDDALAYTLAVPPDAVDVRRFCLLPLWMAKRTLALAETSDALFVPGAPVKISRDEVASLVSACLRDASDDAALERTFAELALPEADPVAAGRPTGRASSDGWTPFAPLKARIERELAARFGPSAPRGEAPVLRESMGYSLLAGGKRLRPILAMLAAEAVGGRAEDALDAALALECVHTYSLIHDDLPAMDDDDLRRGRPTNHVVYGEAVALLAGDALLTYAFERLAGPAATARIGAERALRVLHEVAHASGDAGMVAGQALDLAAEGRAVALTELQTVHRLKTGALIRAAVVAGAIAGGADAAGIARLEAYGEALGLAFQIVDDVLDVTQSTELLGKPQGSDARRDKSTYVRLFGVAQATAMAHATVARAKEALAELGDEGAALAYVADLVVAAVAPPARAARESEAASSLSI